jgi:hypothetical protein
MKKAEKIKVITKGRAEQMIKEGQVEFQSDLKIGYNSIRWNRTGKVVVVEIIASKGN